MYNQTDIPIRPCHRVGFLAALPWFALAVFNLVLGFAYGIVFLALVPFALAGAAYQWNLNGRLCLERSVTHLTITGDGLQARQGGGDAYPVMASPTSRIYPQLAILKLVPTDAIKYPSTVLLWAGKHGAGNISGDQHRRLRAWLRLGSSGDKS